MANTLNAIIPVMLARAGLHLRKKLLAPLLVNSDFGTDARQKGEYIPVSIPRRKTASPVVPSATLTPDDTGFDQVQVQLSEHYHSSFFLNDSDAAKVQAQSDFIPPSMLASIDALAETVNASIWAQYAKFPAFAGVANALPFASNSDYAVDARRVLNVNRVPGPSRRMVLSPGVDASALKLAQFTDADRSGTTRALVEGELGRKFGFDWFWDHDIPSHTTGAAGTPLVDGASQTGTTLIVDGFTTKPSVGDVFTIAGVAGQYVVDAATDLSTGESTLTIYPALASSPANDAAVTFVASHQANLFFHRDAIAFAARPLNDSSALAGDSAFIREVRDEQTGIVLRLERIRQNKRTVWDLDLLWGVEAVRREMGGRLLSTP